MTPKEQRLQIMISKLSENEQDGLISILEEVDRRKMGGELTSKLKYLESDFDVVNTAIVEGAISIRFFDKVNQNDVEITVNVAAEFCPKCNPHGYMNHLNQFIYKSICIDCGTIIPAINPKSV